MNLGSCLCGKVRYQVSKFEPAIAHCHCTMCRKFHGAAFSTFAEVKEKNITWLSDKKHLKSYLAENKSERIFCRECGSSLAFISTYNKQDKSIEIALATLDSGDETLTVNAHIFTEAQVNWLSLSDNIPKFKQFRK
ncbi:MAG: GFA family protein [Thalassotalea sp.]